MKTDDITPRGVRSTVVPPERPDFNEWCKAVRFGCRVPMNRHKRNIR